MKPFRVTIVFMLPIAALLLTGCITVRVDYSTIERPDRSSELDAYNVFVGSWTWQAEMLNAEGLDKQWNGTAEWHWTLDDRALHGVMSSRSARATFEAAGVWSWHPKAKKYIWWMFNNWGYPQEGTAKYDADTKTWRMDYRSVGLDGTTSYGQYSMAVVDKDTLDWTMNEWADALRTIKKVEMKGQYKRKN